VAKKRFVSRDVNRCGTIEQIGGQVLWQLREQAPNRTDRRGFYNHRGITSVSFPGCGEDGAKLVKTKALSGTRLAALGKARYLKPYKLRLAGAAGVPPGGAYPH